MKFYVINLFINPTLPPPHNKDQRYFRPHLSYSNFEIPFNPLFDFMYKTGNMICSKYHMNTYDAPPPKILDIIHRIYINAYSKYYII